MARGWEREHVEEPREARTAPARDVALHSPEVQQQNRLLADLHMQRERILNERTASPLRRSALQAALAHVEEQMRRLGWSA